MADVVNTVTIRLDVDNEAAMAEFNKAQAAMGVLGKKMDTGAKKIAGSFDSQLSPAVKRAANATKRYEADIAELTRRMRAGEIEQQDFTRGVDAATRSLNQASAASSNYALASTRGMGSSRAMGHAVQQAGFQVGDFAVQIAGGQSALRAFIQQGTQLVSMFGPTGAVIGALGAIGGAVIQAFLMSGDAVDDAADKIWSYTEALAAAKDITDELAAAQTKFIGGLTDSRIKGFEDAIDSANTKLTLLQIEAKSANLLGALFGPSDRDIRDAKFEVQKLVAQMKSSIKNLRTIEDIESFDAERKAVQDFNNFIADAENEALATNLKQVKEANAQKKKLRDDEIKDRISFDNFVNDAESAALVLNLKQVKEVAKQKKKDQDDEIKDRIAFDNFVTDAENDALDRNLAQLKVLAARNKKFREDEMKAENDFNNFVTDAENEALARNLKQVKDAADRAEKAWEKQFSKMGDSLADFVKTGKLDFNSLAESIIDDLIRIQIQSSIVKPLSSMLTSIGGSILNGIVGGTSSTLIPPPTANVSTSLAVGGPVSGPGTGTSDSIAAMLSNGEFVVNAKSTKQHRALLEAINSGKVPQKFAAGGIVGASGTLAANNNGGDTIFQVIDQRGANAPPVQTQRGRAPDGREILRAIILPEVAKGISSGQFDSALGTSFGLSRAGSSR
jgi:lambda family phage tail tape measure protein